MTNSEFEEIYKQYFDLVFRYSVKLTKDKHLAEEITSDTFFKAMGAIDKFQGDCKIYSWLCQIAKNTYYSHLRKTNGKSFVDMVDEQADTAQTPIEDLIVQGDSVMEVYAALHLLEEPFKEIFMLRTMGELSFKQIGNVFGKTENWACVTYHRAKKKIQTEMEDLQ